MKKKYMTLALKEAEKAFFEDEVPIGAVIVKNNEVIAMAHNAKERRKCSIFHAEILAIEEACKKIGDWRLEECDIYITLSPCPMCASAIKQSRIKNVYCGLNNLDADSILVVKKIFSCDKTNPSVNFKTNLCTKEVSSLLKKFFSIKRIK